MGLRVQGKRAASTTNKKVTSKKREQQQRARCDARGMHVLLETCAGPTSRRRGFRDFGVRDG